MKRFLISLMLISLIGSNVLAQDEGILTKYTFIPGEKHLLMEDLTSTSIGESPLSLNVNGDAEVVLSGTERWLMSAPSTQLILPVKPKVEDLTLEFLLKTAEKEGETDIHFSLTNESQGYEGNINFGREMISWNGVDSKGDLPNNNIETTLYKTGELIPVALTVQKGRVKLFINKILVMNVANFARIMPDTVVIMVNHNSDGLRYLRDFRMATGIPDIASEILVKGKYTSHGVYFDTASSKVKDDSYAVLKAVADVLAANPDLKILIVGHTDNSGDKAKNLSLSQNRADSVKAYLVSRFQSDPARIKTAGKGDTEPIADNKTADGRSLNRRVEFVRSN
ncbi:MAG TPA: OmpA family protein [Bacillota bacterium]|nr:OmpA family protein [Bacillota bacterium]